MARTGELTIDVEGQTYRLALDINALIAAEEQSKKSFQVLLRSVQEMQLGAIRTVCWAALQRHHSEMSLSDVGEWMQAAGLDRILGAFQSVAPGATPDAEDAKDLGIKPKRPRKARTAA